MQIVVATHNEGKLVEIRRILEEDLGADAENIELVSLAAFTCRIRWKRRHLPGERATQGPRCGHRTGLPAVADDCVIVDAMGNAPGILSAGWAGAHGHDKANNALLLAQSKICG